MAFILFCSFTGLNQAVYDSHDGRDLALSGLLKAIQSKEIDSARDALSDLKDGLPFQSAVGGLPAIYLRADATHPRPAAFSCVALGKGGRRGG